MLLLYDDTLEPDPGGTRIMLLTRALSARPEFSFAHTVQGGPQGAAEAGLEVCGVVEQLSRDRI